MSLLDTFLMKVDITYDKEYIVCNSEQPYELQLLKRFLTRDIANAWLLKKKQPWLNTERCFINEYGMIPSGLWLLVLKFCKQYNIATETTEQFNNYVNQFQLDFDSFNEWVNKTFEGAQTKNGDPFSPRDYQIKAAYTLLKYKKACGEISTSAGKTLISFIIFKYLVDNVSTDKILYIVPSVDLATQSAEKYEEYESYLRVHHHNWSIGILKAGLKKAEKEAVESCNILFGTFQSLCKRDNQFFSRFTACICDECHHAGSSDSIHKIFRRCSNLNYSIGVTGTFPKDDKIENLNLQTYIGPVVYELTADQLIKNEHAATPIYVVFQIIDWAANEEKRQLYYNRCQKAVNQNDLTLGNKLLKQEQEFINASYIRMRYIGDLAIRMKKNTLILFGDVKGEYGKKIVDYIKDNSEKNAYYIDGTTPTQNRDYYKDCMKNDHDGKTVIVGSIYTMGEGIDVPNIESIFLVNTAKSERMVRQIVGRGIRNSEGKEKCVLYDFVDDLRYSETKDRKYHENYMWKHYLERRKIYQEQNFPTYEQKISFK